MSQIEVTMIGIISSNAVGKLKAFMAFKNTTYTPYRKDVQLLMSSPIFEKYLKTSNFIIGSDGSKELYKL